MAITPETRRLIERSLSLTLSRRRAMQTLAAGAGVAALGASAPAVFAQATPEAPGVGQAPYDGPLAEDQVLRLPINEPATLDPGASTGFDELAIFFNTYDGLTRIDQQTGEVVGAAAESWEWSEDLTEYTFHLKPDLQWSDGTPLTANDFVYSLAAGVGPEHPLRIRTSHVLPGQRRGDRQW